MKQFQVIVEDFQSRLQKIVEVVDLRFDQNAQQWSRLGSWTERVDQNLDYLKTKLSAQSEQIGRLQEGQTTLAGEIKSLSRRGAVDREVRELRKRVSRLEKKTA